MLLGTYYKFDYHEGNAGLNCESVYDALFYNSIQCLCVFQIILKTKLKTKSLVYTALNKLTIPLAPSIQKLNRILKD